MWKKVARVLEKKASRVREEVRSGRLSAEKARGFVPTPAEYTAGLTRGNDALLARTGFERKTSMLPPEFHEALSKLPSWTTRIQDHLLRGTSSPMTIAANNTIVMPDRLPAQLTGGVPQAAHPEMHALVLRHEIDEARHVPKAGKRNQKFVSRIAANYDAGLSDLKRLSGHVADAPGIAAKIRVARSDAPAIISRAQKILDSSKEMQKGTTFSSHLSPEVVRREAGHANFLSPAVHERMADLRGLEMTAMSRHLRKGGIPFDPVFDGYRKFPSLSAGQVEGAVKGAPRTFLEHGARVPLASQLADIPVQGMRAVLKTFGRRI